MQPLQQVALPLARPAVRRLRRTSAVAALTHLRAPSRADRVSEAVDTFRRRFGTTPAGDRPVFVFSSGWRAGSTLLQRLVVSSDEVHLWGEPWSQPDTLRFLAESFAGVTDEHPWDEWLWDGSVDGRLADQWIANLSPAPEALVEGHRSLLRTYLASPDPAKRWGMKEVRYGVEHAEYLRLLFPEASIVFVHRDPYDQWRSYGAFRSWYDRWPDPPVVTPRGFGCLWQRITEGFVERGADAGVLVVRYDDLVSGAAVDGIERHVGTRVDRSVLEARVGSSVDDHGAPLGRREERALRRAVEPLAGRLGYRR